MKKAEIKVIALLSVITLLLAFAVIITGKTDKEAPAPEYLLYVPSSEIQRLDFANSSGYVHLVRSGSVWNMADDKNFDVNASSVEILLQALAKAQVKSKISLSTQSELDEYSLLSPDCIIEYQFANGENHSVRIGAMSGITEELYICLDDDTDTVYVTTPEIGQAFSCRKLDFLAYPAIPTPKDGHTAVEVKNLYGTTALFKDGEDWFVSVGEDTEKVAEKTAYNYYFLTWDMHWRGRVEYNAEDFGKYDLARPRIAYTLHYTENGVDKCFALELGSSLPDGTCYAKLKDDNTVFLLDALMADWLEGTKAEKLMQK